MRAKLTRSHQHRRRDRLHPTRPRRNTQPLRPDGPVEGVRLLRRMPPPNPFHAAAGGRSAKSPSCRPALPSASLQRHRRRRVCSDPPPVSDLWPALLRPAVVRPRVRPAVGAQPAVTIRQPQQQVGPCLANRRSLRRAGWPGTAYTVRAAREHAGAAGRTPLAPSPRSRRRRTRFAASQSNTAAASPFGARPNPPAFGQPAFGSAHAALSGPFASKQNAASNGQQQPSPFGGSGGSGGGGGGPTQSGNQHIFPNGIPTQRCPTIHRRTCTPRSSRTSKSRTSNWRRLDHFRMAPCP